MASVTRLDICYVDGQPCDCGAYDVISDGCPRDEYAHEEDDECWIDDEYDLQNASYRIDEYV